jgi:DNA-binding NarL/FixJ family response regulator
MKRDRIVLADDHALFLGALKSLLEPEFEIVGAFTDGRALVEQSKSLSPDAVVLDIGMPLMNGLIAGQRLKQEMPAVKLIYVTVHEDPSMVADAFKLGASSYILKRSGPTELPHAIREALKGRIYVTPVLSQGVAGSLVHGMKHTKPRSLTLRQKEVLQLLAEGRSMKEAAALLSVTPRTIAFHKYTMMEQLEVKNGAELIRYAIRNAIVSA